MLKSSITLSIVSHGHMQFVKRLLNDLRECDDIDGTRVILTLNIPGETVDPSVYPNLNLTLITNQSPLGFGANHNIAFGHCDTPWFIILNPDVQLPDKQIFSSLLSQAESLPGPGIIAPQIIDSNGKIEGFVRKNLTPLSLIQRRITKQLTIEKDIQSFFWIAGMFMFVSSKAFRKINGFDERFYLYCEDYDLSARLYLAGYSLTVHPTAIAIHEAQRDSHRSFKYLRWHLASVIKVWSSIVFWRVLYSDLKNFVTK